MHEPADAQRSNRDHDDLSAQADRSAQRSKLTCEGSDVLVAEGNPSPSWKNDVACTEVNDPKSE